MNESSNESVSWRDAHLYALELVDENVFTKEELLDSMSKINTNNPNKMYERLADMAIERHSERFDDNDIATEVFYNNKPVLFFDDIYEDYVKNENKKYKVIGSAIITLACVATVAHTVLDERISINDMPVYIINLNLIIAGIALVLKNK